MNHEVLYQRSNEWVILDSIDNGYLSPEEDGKIIDNNIKTETFLSSEDEIVNNILESEFINSEVSCVNVKQDEKCKIETKEDILSEEEKKNVNITKEIVKKIPKSVWINIVLHLLKNTGSNYDWRIALTYSLASTTILIIKNRAIILNLIKFTFLNGIPFIIDKTTCLKSYYFKKN